MSPLISLIIPMYKVESYISECLESVFSQIDDDIEVILVDDGSPDNSSEIAKGIIHSHMPITKNTRIIHQDNQGLSGARNTGIKNAKGEYLCFLDSDDILLNGFFTTIRKYILNNRGSKIFAFNAISFSEVNNGKPVSLGSVAVIDGSVIPTSVERDNEKKNEFLIKECNRGVWYAWARVCKRELFETIEFPVGKNMEDFQTIPLLYLMSKGQITNIPTSLIAYRINLNGIMRSASRKEINDLDHTASVFYSKRNSEPDNSIYMSILFVGALKNRFTLGVDILGFFTAYKEQRKLMKNYKRLSKEEVSALFLRNKLFYNSVLIYFLLHKAKKIIK